MYSFIATSYFVAILLDPSAEPTIAPMLLEGKKRRRRSEMHGSAKPGLIGFFSVFYMPQKCVCFWVDALKRSLRNTYSGGMYPNVPTTLVGIVVEKFDSPESVSFVSPKSATFTTQTPSSTCTLKNSICIINTC
jgi:hypothetical protein